MLGYDEPQDLSGVLPALHCTFESCPLLSGTEIPVWPLT